MKLFLAVVFSCLILMPVRAQHWLHGVTLTQGLNYAFLKTEDQQSMAGHSMGIEIFARHHKSLSAIFFEPGLRYGRNVLLARATDQLHIKVRQHAIGFAPRAGLTIGKNAYLQVGLLGEFVSYRMVETVTADGFHLSRPEFSEHLHPRIFMGAVMIGFGGAPASSRSVEIFFDLHQYITSPFSEPFKLDALGSAQPPVFNATALSTVMLAGIRIKLSKHSKRNSEGTE